MGVYFMARHAAEARSPLSFLYQLLAIVVVSALALGAQRVTSQFEAFAQNEAVSATLITDGQTFAGEPKLTTGDTVILRVSYDNSVTPGSSVTISVGDELSLPAGTSLTVPAGNTAIQSMTTDANGNVVITFADPFPSDVEQGALDISYVVNIRSQRAK